MAEFDSFDDKDDFWDISKLVPKQRSTLSRFATSAGTVDYTPRENPATGASRPAEERILTLGMLGDRGDEDIYTYTPENAGLIKRVSIIKYHDKYDFYDGFRKAALLYYDCPAAKCPFAEFYSYMPQYAHLTRAQRSYYLYWRSELRRGKFIKTDYSYIYLYVYEILNLPDKIPPVEGLKLLIEVWRHYRRTLPKLDASFSIWVQDYCLVHGLPCPSAEVSDFIFDVVGSSTFKEFYFADVEKSGISAVEPLLACLSDYDWRRGKMLSDKSDTTTSVISSFDDYREHMLSAMHLLLLEIWRSGALTSDDVTTTLRRDAFPRSLCTHMVKSKLEIEYVALGNATALRANITAAVRYAENKLRILLGVKSRLAVKGLSEEYKTIIDFYFSKITAKADRARRDAMRPEYEKLYEAPTEEWSLSGADEIERASWSTTARLVEDFDSNSVTMENAQASRVFEFDEDENVSPRETNSIVFNFDSEIQDEKIVKNSPQNFGDTENGYGLTKNELEFICGLLSTPKESITPDTEIMAENINNAFSDNFGDIIITETDGVYEIIEDYKEEVREWLTKQS